jgi:hypothetical protein
VFVNRCLRRILNICWPEVISKEELRQRTKEDSIKNQIRWKKWNWRGHTLRKTERSIERQAPGCQKKRTTKPVMETNYR